ncbi:MAG: 1-acyl-sn-glycerol-3-phosphate acyltransferase, partial [Candidatus Sericytochromatia bacterium]|nr:1-acyl-sn-glycerol-3-phosphate acyltransferase [Candidatus Tanganyikabacteria bacterium]
MSLRHFLGFCAYVWPDFLRKYVMARKAKHSEEFYREWMPRWAQGVCRAAGVEIHTTGLDRIGPGPYLVAPNHQGYLDVPALMGTLPGRPRFVMKRELLKWPFFGRMLYHSGMIAINRADRHQAIAAIEDALRKTKPGDMVYMFPEGTRTRDGRLGRVKRGIFYFAAHSGLPILPVA